MFSKQKWQRVKRLFIFAFFLSITTVLLFPLSNKVHLGAVPFVDPIPPTPVPRSPIPGTIDSSAIPAPVVPCLRDDLPGQPGSVLRNPEFHSLRPYQASPCGKSPIAYFCNNDYKIIEEVSREWSPDWCWEGSVDGSPGTGFFCEMEPNATATGSDGRIHGVYIIGEQDGRDYAISLNNVKYPILGNTEDVRNSYSNTDTFDATIKMNEYVNWYLQGAIEKAEYGMQYPKYYVSHAGPTKKLLPFDILNHRRLEVLHDGTVDEFFNLGLATDYQGDRSLLTCDPETGECTIEENKSHNQIVVCTVDGGLFGSIPVPCYAGDGGPADGLKRLIAWWDLRGSTPDQTFYDWTINDVWGGTTPPFPWQFDEPYLYRKALLEWSGKTCIPVPLSDTYACLGYSPRTLSTLYEFVPLGNSPDKNAGHLITRVQVRANGQTKIALLGYELENSPVLHYPHTESTVQVSALLNEINTPLECVENENPTTEKLPGEGLSCCPSGFYHYQGSCVSNVLDSACGTFASGLCTIVELAPGDFTCNSVNDISDACQQQIIDAASPNVEPDTFCSVIFGVIGGEIANQFGVLATCRGLVSLLTDAISGVVVQPPSCQSGLTCNQGNCVNPNRIAPLSCEKIAGRGTNYEPSTCEFTEVRTNLGDSLTFRDPMSFMYVRDVRTRVDIIQCSNSGEIERFLEPIASGGCGGDTIDPCLTTKCETLTMCNGICPFNPLPGFCTDWPECEAEVNVTIPTSPKIPNIDQIWMNTVVNNNSSFRRIFPKIIPADDDPNTPDTPVQCIKEIPGVSDVTYITNWETNLTRIDTAGPNTYPGGGELSQSQGKLFFPHLGTIYEYFLKGIQTALRPKGFGNGPLPQGENCPEPFECKKVAEEYGIPECVLEGIMQIESGGGTGGTGGCGSVAEVSCCTGIGCGPAQITCGQINLFSGGENIDVCDECGAATLLARALLLKVCIAKGVCQSHDWAEWGNEALKFAPLDESDPTTSPITAACYFHGLVNGCYPSGCTQYRWGAGMSYGDAVSMFCGGATVSTMPQGPFEEFCEDCSREVENSGLPPLQCN
jgi:hypothetical protein